MRDADKLNRKSSHRCLQYIMCTIQPWMVHLPIHPISVAIRFFFQLIKAAKEWGVCSTPIEEWTDWSALFTWQTMPLLQNQTVHVNHEGGLLSWTDNWLEGKTKNFAAVSNKFSFHVLMMPLIKINNKYKSNYIWLPIDQNCKIESKNTKEWKLRTNYGQVLPKRHCLMIADQTVDMTTSNRWPVGYESDGWQPRLPPRVWFFQGSEARMQVEAKISNKDRDNVGRVVRWIDSLSGRYT